MRVNDYNVERFLAWGRNYGEIESYEKIAASGRKWLVRLPAGRTFTVDGGEVTWLTGPAGIVPDELVLTSREALAFGYGLAVAGGSAKTRREFAVREWDWDN